MSYYLSFPAVAAVCGALALPAASDAATLRYDFNAVITTVAYDHWCYDDGDCDEYEAAGDATTYQGPGLSAGAGSVTVDIREQYGDEYLVGLNYSILGLPHFSGDTWMTDYDPLSGSASFRLYTGYDLLEFDIFPGASFGGSGYLGWEQDFSGVDWAEAWFEFHDVTVTDLSAPIPTPLPASLPLLAAGAAALGALRWRKRAARAV